MAVTGLTGCTHLVGFGADGCAFGVSGTGDALGAVIVCFDDARFVFGVECAFSFDCTDVALLAVGFAAWHTRVVFAIEGALAEKVAVWVGKSAVFCIDFHADAILCKALSGLLALCGLAAIVVVACITSVVGLVV